MAKAKKQIFKGFGINHNFKKHIILFNKLYEKDSEIGEAIQQLLEDIRYEKWVDSVCELVSESFSRCDGNHFYFHELEDEFILELQKSLPAE